MEKILSLILFLSFYYEGIFMLFQFIVSIKRELNKAKNPVELNIAQMSLER